MSPVKYSIAGGLLLQEMFVPGNSAGRICLIANEYVSLVNITFDCLVTLIHNYHNVYLNYLDS